MANRNQYTSNPGYQGATRTQGPQGRQPAPSARQQPQQPRQQVRYQEPPKRQRPMKDLVIFAAMLFVIPLLGIIGVFVQSFLWIFIVVTAVCLVALWVFRCFTQGTRSFMSGILLALAVLALVAAIDLSPKQGDYPVYGGTDAYGQTATNAATSQVNNPAFAGMGSVAATATAPILTDTAPWQTDAGTGDDTQQQPAGIDNNTPIVDTPTDTGGGSVGGGAAAVGVTGEAQQVLETYLQCWKDNDWETMSKYTTLTWRKAQKSLPQQQLYWNHFYWILEGWTITGDAAGATTDLVTFKVVTDVKKNNSARTPVKMSYDVLVINEDGIWHVDPDSISNGQDVTEQANAATPAEGEGGYQVAPDPTPTPEPAVTSKTVLWYNSKGGKRYHLEEKCSSLDPEYYSSMKKFTYGELGDKAYKNLIPCGTCGAPDRE